MWRCGAEARGEVRSARRGGRVMEEGREEARWDGGPDGEKDEAVHLRSLVISHRVLQTPCCAGLFPSTETN